VSLDYPNAQAVTLLAEASGQEGYAKLVMAQAPDASLPIEQVTEVPTRVELGWDSVKSRGPCLSSATRRAARESASRSSDTPTKA
jgi:hypothetical protein